ncbi:MAG TPA: hypothetical protein EYQ50_19760 [Verrucomicrobiales bacterium]|nr:hypothetical protein [Verrucomicrobiales bacterium]HIL69106.1 hypothetical protein [Verrucomicrobiota bacterium]
MLLQFPSSSLVKKPLSPHRKGSVLIIVLWIATGLVTITLLFGHSMFFEFKAADNNYAGHQAEQAIEGAVRYIQYMLSNQEQIGVVPEQDAFLSDAIPIGGAYFWIIGREPSSFLTDSPSFGLIAESSKINLNQASIEMLELIPGMIPELAAAMVDWRDSDEEITPNGAENESYLFLTPPYLCKNAPYESIDEVRLVFGAQTDQLYGEDTNQNGYLDYQENDRDLSFPLDNQDGFLDIGILDYLTVWSRDLSLRSDGSARVNVYGDNEDELNTVLADALGQERADEIIGSSGGEQGSDQNGASGNSQGGDQGGGRNGDAGDPTGGGSSDPPAEDSDPEQDDEEEAPTNNLLEYFMQSGMTAAEFDLVAPDLTVTDAPFIEGLINVNTATEAVLATVPGIDESKAAELVGYRRTSIDSSRSIAWILDVLDDDSAQQAAPFLTTYSFQYTADIAAVGRKGRGYRRVRFVFSFSEDGIPEVVYRKDMTRQGWALGPEVRRQLELQNHTQNVRI